MKIDGSLMRQSTDGLYAAGAHQRPSAALTTARAAGPAVEVRSTVSPRRTSVAPAALEQRRALRARCRPRARRRARCRARRPASVEVGERASAPSARGRGHGMPRPGARASAVVASGDDLGKPRAVRLLRRLAHDRRPARAALLGLRGVPSRDAARRLPRHDLVDAELGRGLHGELVAVALGERLHEHDARRGRRDVRRAR